MERYLCNTTGTNLFEALCQITHIRDALQSLPSKLIKIRREPESSGWYTNEKSVCSPAKREEYFRKNNKSPDCDEYPFGSTVEGGPAGDYLLKAFGFPGVSLKLLDLKQNRSAGNSLKQFYRNCGVEIGLFFFVRTSVKGVSEGHYTDNNEVCY